MKQWAKREEQIERVMGATVGMYGDLQGIAGKSLQEIEGLDLNCIHLASIMRPRNVRMFAHQIGVRQCLKELQK